MKYLFFIPLLCCLFAFIAPKQDDNFKVVRLKQKDWKELERYTTYGATTTALVREYNRVKIFNLTQYQHEKAQLSQEQKRKLREILSKYERKKTTEN